MLIPKIKNFFSKLTLTILISISITNTLHAEGFFDFLNSQQNEYKQLGFKYHFEQIGQLNISRYKHSATLLDDERVLIVGGVKSDTVYETSQSELYIPNEKKFILGPKSLIARQEHQAIKLQDGRVLIVGGHTGGWGGTELEYIKECEIYDPTKNCFEYTGNLNYARQDHCLNLLKDGRVLISGGSVSAIEKSSQGKFNCWYTAEIFDPKTGVFTFTPKMKENRRNHTATLLPNGCVLIAGGIGKLGLKKDPDEGIHNTAEIYDPTRNCFEYTGGMKFRRQNHYAISLCDGKVMVIGGHSLKNAEIYELKTNNFLDLIDLNDISYKHSAIILFDNFVLTSDYGKEPQWEIYDVKNFKGTLLKEHIRTPAWHIPVHLKDRNEILYTGSKDGWKSGWFSDPGTTSLLFVYDKDID